MADVFVGRLVKAFGIRGEIKLEPAADFWENVLRSKHLVLRRERDGSVEEKAIVLESHRPHGNCYVVGVEGIKDRDGAEDLVGGELLIGEERIDVDLPQRRLPFQVLGATVRKRDGTILGKVTAIMFSPAHDVYEVTGGEGAFLLPVVPEFVVSIDDERREMTIETIPGLVDGGNQR